MNRRTLLRTAAALSAAGLAGCSISTPLGDFGGSGGGSSGSGSGDGSDGGGGSGGGSTQTPTPVTATRQPSTVTPTPTRTSTATPTPTDTETATPTATPTPTDTETATPTATPTPSGNPAVTPAEPQTPIPCVVDGSCVPDGVVDNGPTVPQDPVFIPEEPLMPVEPIAVDPSVFNNTEQSSVGDPTGVSNSGTIDVTITPETGKAGSSTVGSEGAEQRGDMVCTTQRRRVTSGSGTNFLLNPQLGVIWPGAIIEAESIAKGQFSPALSSSRRNGTPSSQIRNPLELSVSLRNISGKNTRTLQNPSVGRYRTELDDILGQYNQNANTPARMNYTIHQIHSEKQLDVTLGVHYNSPTVEVDNKFDFSSQSETNKLMAQFYQQYYSADISLPNPVANGVVSDPGTYLKRNDVVVNNVSYGRILLFSAESKYERTDIENALDVAMKIGGGNGSASLDIKHKQVLRDTKINVQVLGGAATQGAQLISKPGEGALQAITNFIQQGATYDPQRSPGVPIAYQTKYLSNLDTSNTYLTTTYTERNCRPKTRSYRVHNMSWKVITESDPGNEEEIYGDVYVVGWPFWPDASTIQSSRIEPRGGRSDGRVWHRSRSSHVNIRQGRRKDLGVDAELMFEDAHELDKRKSYIQVTAIPHEKDPTSNNDFGNKKNVKWFLDQAPSDPDRAGRGGGTFTQRWNDHGSELELSFDISPIPP
ncbi:thiol-activated cytolysin family protein [Haloarcula sp. GH36]|uniref:thiol-activated cytolysin family protein n=1 Tax=Haloarcula montana TaxID=3111776 RepID=UPI002D76E75F|nr:thiol-activated cytolysin family protein [Haloarcula sp. GH36]